MLWKQRVEERRHFQYVVGCEHWRDLVLCVEEGVLIPRPETELIVDLVGGVVLGNDGLWADLGTGSGAIAIGIVRVLGSGGRVIATDLSPAAIGVAAFNVQGYGLQGCKLKLDGMNLELHWTVVSMTNGEEQCKYLVEYMENDAGGSFCNLNVVPDFAGINRFVTGIRVTLSFTLRYTTTTKPFTLRYKQEIIKICL
nr:uncharacterized protein LOC103428096 [Malus domestica]